MLLALAKVDKRVTNVSACEMLSFEEDQSQRGEIEVLRQMDDQDGNARWRRRHLARIMQL